MNTNYRHTDSDFDKAFPQGLITSTDNHHTPNHTLPRKYISALTNLAKHKNITITSPEKGGGIAILNKTLSQQNYGLNQRQQHLHSTVKEKYIALLQNPTISIIEKNSNRLGIKTIIRTSKTIKTTVTVDWNYNKKRKSYSDSGI